MVSFDDPGCDSRDDRSLYPCDTLGYSDLASNCFTWCRWVRLLLPFQMPFLWSYSRYFSYFTELTHIGICSYYWASFTQTFCYALRQRHSIERTPEYPLQRWPRIFQLLHVMLGTTIISYRVSKLIPPSILLSALNNFDDTAILVTIVFWALLASPAVFSTKFGSTFSWLNLWAIADALIVAWSNISIHVLNTAWSLFEMIGTNTPPPRWSMLPCMIIILALYLALAYVTHATQGFYRTSDHILRMLSSFFWPPYFHLCPIYALPDLCFFNQLTRSSTLRRHIRSSQAIS